MKKNPKSDVKETSSTALDFLAQRLYFERTKRDWSHHKLAEESKLSSATCFNIERMIGCPTILTVEKLANAFGQTLQQFFSGETKRPPRNILGRRKSHINKRRYRSFDEDGNVIVRLGRKDF